MTHAELVTRAGAWLKTMGCPLVFTEMVTTWSETPDAIGWRNSGSDSFLVECKASRSDFLADKNKYFRGDGVPALGLYRYYLCPPEMIKVADLPPRWGLLYCREKTVEFIVGKHPKKWDVDAAEAFAHKHSTEGEMRLLYSALSRLKVDMGDKQFHARVLLPYHKRQKEIAARTQDGGLTQCDMHEDESR